MISIEFVIVLRCLLTYVSFMCVYLSVLALSPPPSPLHPLCSTILCKFFNKVCFFFFVDIFALPLCLVGFFFLMMMLSRTPIDVENRGNFICHTHTHTHTPFHWTFSSVFFHLNRPNQWPKCESLSPPTPTTVCDLCELFALNNINSLGSPLYTVSLHTL